VSAPVLKVMDAVEVSRRAQTPELLRFPVFVMRGGWVSGPGSRIEKRGDYAYLRGRNGFELMCDREAVLALCLALGIETKEGG